MKGWLRVGGLMLLLVGAGAGGGSVLVRTALAVLSGELVHTPKGGTARLLRVHAEPGEFWFRVSLNAFVALVLITLFAVATAAVLRAKRASGRTWIEFVAGLARTQPPSSAPATSRAGNVIAWILLVPFLLIAAALVATLASLR